MKSFLIVYKLNNPSSDYTAISEKIKSYEKWAKPFERTWLVQTERSVVEVRDELAAAIDKKGSILVMDVGSAAWATSRVNTEVTEWMHKNM